MLMIFKNCIEANIPPCWSCSQISGIYTCTLKFYRDAFINYKWNIKHNILKRFQEPMPSDDPANIGLYIKTALMQTDNNQYIDFVEKYLILI
jgi:hypothetical protein